MKEFQKSLDELESLGARVAGVSADPFAAQDAFAEKERIEFPLLSDWPEMQTIDAFGAWGGGTVVVARRTTFVFDGEGVLRALIDDQDDMHAHARGSLEAVKEIVAG